MNNRPKNTDTMEDILKMQSEFKKKEKEENLKPSAELKRCYNPEEPKLSEFAKRRNLKKPQAKVGPELIMGDIVENKFKIKSGIEDTPMETDFMEKNVHEENFGFPKPEPIDIRAKEFKNLKEIKGRSIFAQMMNLPDLKTPKENLSQPSTSSSIGGNSHLLTEQDANNIHQENLRTLSQMSSGQILEEQEALRQSLDPQLLDFLKNKRNRQPEVKKSEEKDITPEKQQKVQEDIVPPALDFLDDDHAKNWIHFDVFEPEKLEWTKDIQRTFFKLKKGEKFEARFDWRGFMLPYSESEEAPPATNDGQDLYLHGEEPHRPGYTLQELFRLARSNVLQQRVAAITAISGVLNIYNQGYYDDILELPISKIFFFLRFALDENTPAIVEATSKALASLFYNDTDETLLDISYETKNGIRQPVMEVTDNNQESEVEPSLDNLNLNEIRNSFLGSKLTADDVKEDPDDDFKSVKDFQLAEIDLMQCLMRTNIIERISYILTVGEPSETTISSCIKILIRLARTNKNYALKVLNREGLAEQLIKKFLPGIEQKSDQRCPHYIVLKLLRVLGSYDVTFCLKLRNLQLLDVLKGYLYTKQDINITLLKVQIESIRFLRMYLNLVPDESLFGDLIQPMRYLLEWHYQFLSFDQENHFVIRQHVSSLLYLISCGNNIVTYSIFSELVQMCMSKWFTMASKGELNEFSQKLLLSALLDAGAGLVSFSPDFFFGFIDNYLLKFLQCQSFESISRNLCTSSSLFSDLTDRSKIYKPLPNLGAVSRRTQKTPPNMIISRDYSIHFSNSLLTFIQSLSSAKHIRNEHYHRLLSELFYNQDLKIYLEAFAQEFNQNIATNWFMKLEIDFIFNVIFAQKTLKIDQSILKIAFNLLGCLCQDQVKQIFEIFDKIIFNEKYYGLRMDDHENYDFVKWKRDFNGVVVSQLKVVGADSRGFAVENWQKKLLDVWWPYSMLLILLYNVETSAERKIVETELNEEEIILTTLRFTNLLEQNHIKLISNNQILMYLMLVYFGKDLNFLDAPFKLLVKEKLERMKDFHFNFNVKLNGEKSFESLYAIFLDTFQSNSYGDDLFSLLVMLPLAQKYDVRWRKMVWSEYVSTMKFINCHDDDIIGGIEGYLSPVEKDLSLLKSYAAARNSNLLMEKSIPYKIAQHHLSHRVDN